MKCKECIWWFSLQEAHDKTTWRNCLAMDYPACKENFTEAEAECVLPHLATLKQPPKSDGGNHA